MDDLVGQALGQYQLREVIRRGGGSTLYKAHQAELHRFVAVRVLASPGDPDFAARFEREMRLVARLQHPSIVPVLDHGRHGELAYVVTAYVEGGSRLEDLLGRPLAPALACDLIGHVLGALAFAHDHGVVHRDLKPANVLMSSPTWPMLGNFGVARMLGGDGQGPASRKVVGTPAYMAPEQAFGLPAEPRTDLYSAGVVLYEMLTGRVPFEEATPAETLLRQAYEPPPPPRVAGAPDLPHEVEAIALRALAKEPARRFATAAEMAGAVRTALTVIAPGATTAEAEAMAEAYAAGVRAFAAGRWDEAVERLGRVLADDPGYEDVEELFETARAQRDGGAGPPAGGGDGPAPPAGPAPVLPGMVR
ncbi:MAG TPA: serine/threonine-protein kinase [Actinomycetota bacterium]